MPDLLYEKDMGIQSTEGICGGDACIRTTRIPVWTLVSLRKQGASESDLLFNFPNLTKQDLQYAWDYYENHTQEIEQAIAAQDDE